jgi:hypothetical protein
MEAEFGIDDLFKTARGLGFNGSFVGGGGVMYLFFVSQNFGHVFFIFF